MTVKTTSSAATSTKIAIIGGGFSGIGVAIRLLQRGVHDFVILEKASALGGTWRDNTYPGCACDVPSHLYSYSFAPKTDWTRMFAEQPEIRAYTLEIAERYGVLPHVRLDTELLRSTWDDTAKRWQIETSRGAYSAQFVVAGQGPLHEPRLPNLPGLASFRGVSVHTAKWRNDLDLRGKRVVVIGTGSSAIQLVPKIQPQVAKLTLFQRTAPWVLPKLDYEITPTEKWMLANIPGFWRAIRGGIYGITELIQLAQRSPSAMQQLQKIASWHLTRAVRDPSLRAALTPDFTLGCKRMLFSNTYYPALQAANTEVVAQGVREIREHGVVGEDRIVREADVIVFATGFHVADTSVPARITGRDGKRLDQAWNGSPEAYLGTTVAGFPNSFFVLGPNTGNGHGSAFTMIEAQAKYIASAIELADREQLASIEVRPGAQRAWNEDVQNALAGTVFNSGGCKSWYIDANGRNSSIYPWTTIDMRRRMRRFDAEHYELRPATSAAVKHRVPTPIEVRGAVVAITGGARGIGLETARAFAAAGAIVCIGDLDGPLAREVATTLGPRARGYTLDVSRRASYAQFVADIERTVGPIEVLVNNAGIMPTGRFLDESDDVYRAVFDVNVFGVSLGMRLVAPKMIERGRGHIVNVASLAGKVPVPWMATYVGTKHAVVGITDAVRTELRGTGITLSTVMPGVVRTQLAQGFDMRGTFSQSPEQIARAIVDSVRTRRADVVVPTYLRPMAWFFALAPKRLAVAAFGLAPHERLVDDKAVVARRGYEDAARAQARASEPSGEPASRSA